MSFFGIAGKTKVHGSTDKVSISREDGWGGSETVEIDGDDVKKLMEVLQQYLKFKTQNDPW